MQRLMKKWLAVLAGVFIFGFGLLAPVQSAFAAVTTWTFASDSNSAEIEDFGVIANAILGTDVPTLAENDEFGLYDTNATSLSDANTLTLLDNDTSSTTFYFQATATGGYKIYVDDGHSLTLSGKTWAFYFKTGNSYYTTYFCTSIGDDYSLSLSESADSVKIRTNGLEKVTTPDAETPVPTTILLLGSGLVGMVGLRRRKDS